MIKTFKHKGLEDFFYDNSKKGINPKHANKLALILDHLEESKLLKDMNFSGSGLHLLHGDLEGMYAIKITGNWRIVFRFNEDEGDVYDVEYMDYH